MRKELLDIPIDWITKEELTRKLKQFVVNKKPHQITTVNPEFLVISTENKNFQKVLQESDLSLPDGTGLVLAQTLNDKEPKNSVTRWIRYFMLGFQFILMPHSFTYKRITGIELTDILMELSAKEDWKVYLLGAGPGIAEQAANIWEEIYPGVKIVGATDANPGDAHTVRDIKKADPDILLVAYGAPKQDLFIAKYKDELKVPVMVGVGGTFDTLVGNKPNPPKLIKTLGLEWLIYLLMQPKRFKRIWRSTWTFSRLILKQKV